MGIKSKQISETFVTHVKATYGKPPQAMLLSFQNNRQNIQIWADQNDVERQQPEKPLCYVIFYL